MADAKKVNWTYWGIMVLIGVGGYFFGKWLATSGLEIFPAVNAALSTSVIVAFGVGALYIFMGLLLLFAIALPKVGATALSGVTSEDLLDNRKLYLYQTVSAFVFGIALLALAGAGPVGMFDPMTGGIVFAVAMLIGIAFYILSMPLLDELLRASTIEAAAISYALTLLGIGTWAAFAYVGMVPAPELLDIVTSFWIVALVGSVWAGARRGMLDD